MQRPKHTAIKLRTSRDLSDLPLARGIPIRNRISKAERQARKRRCEETDFVEQGIDSFLDVGDLRTESSRELFHRRGNERSMLELFPTFHNSIARRTSSVSVASQYRKRKRLTER